VLQEGKISLTKDEEIKYPWDYSPTGDPRTDTTIPLPGIDDVEEDDDDEG